jgi:hypothetical protein
MPSKNSNIRKKKEVENEVIEIPADEEPQQQEEEETEEEIQKSKEEEPEEEFEYIQPPTPKATKPKKEDKRKAPRTPAQQEQFLKTKERLQEKHQKSREEKEKAKKEKEELTKERIIKKAIALKKKQIKEMALLDDISDDETPLQEINKIVHELPSRFRKANETLPTPVNPFQNFTFY